MCSVSTPERGAVPPSIHSLSRALGCSYIHYAPPPPPPQPATKAPKGAAKSKAKKYTIDTSKVAEEKVIDPADYEKYLREHIKVSNKTGNLGEAVKVERKGNKIDVTTTIDFSKRYIKYLTKRYLKKQDVREYIRVIASSKTGYELKFFKVAEDAEEDDE